jgi:phosphopantetheinyl transferase
VVAFIVLGRKERETWRTLPGSESRRTEWLLGKAAAKEAVRMLLKDRHGLNVWPADIEIDTDRDGRAIVSGKWAHVIGGPPLVSVSHSQGVVAAAAADRSSYKGIGIDIEVLRATGNGLDDLAFCQEELALIKQFSCEDADAWRLRLWCAKESVAKSTGKGLLGLPKAIRADRIDPQTGDLQLVLSESYAAVSGTVAGQRIRAHSFQDSNLIGSIAAIPADEPGRCAAEPEASRCIKVSEASRMPFLGEILSHVPGDRISASRLFNLEEDLFLLDHALGRNISICDPELKGLPVMPLTVSLEMMAEAATLLRPQMLLVGMRDIRASRWLAFDRRQITIRIEATCPHSREVRVKLWDDATAVPTAPAVEGTIVFAHAYPTPAASGEFNLTHQRPSIWSPEALYTEGMFHGPLFRGVTSVDAWGENGLTATLRSEPATGFFRSTVAHRFILDPVLMDAAGQLVAYWFVEEHQDIGFNTYPYRIDAIRFYGPSIAPPAKVEGRVRIQTVTAGKLKADIQVLDTIGKVRMEFVGWEDRPIRLPSPFYRARFKPAAAFLSEACPKWVERLPSQLSLECCRMDAYDNHLLDAHGGIWLQVLGHLALSSAERQAWNTLSSRGVPEIDWLLARIAGKDAARRLFKAKYGLLLCMADIEIDSAGRCCIVKGSRRDAIPTTPTVSVACADKIGVALAVEKIERCGIAVMCLSTFNGKENRFKFADEERRLCVQAGIGRCSEWTPIIACAKQAAEKAIGPRNDVGDTLKLSGLDPKEGIIEFTADGSSFGGSLGPFSQRFRVCIIREADLAVCIAFVPGEFAEKGDGR